MQTDSTYTWECDQQLEGFETTRLLSGDFQATLIRADNNPPTPQRAVLYIHGFTDYFFQAHLAAAYQAAGYAFYAIDLHGYGRSLKPTDKPNFCRHITDYYPELDAAIGLIKATGVEQLVVNGHSTGGLIASLYAHEGQQGKAIDALFLNSPFFAFPLYRLEKILLAWAIAIGRLFPYLAVQRRIPSLYAQTLLREFRGQWQYNTELKPPEGFALYTGWIRAIVKAQQRLQRGLKLHCPVLVMHSARSLRTLQWTDEVMGADIVLDVKDMRRYGPGLGEQVELIAIENGLHDLVLSAPAVREVIFQQLFAWLDRALEPSTLARE